MATILRMTAARRFFASAASTAAHEPGAVMNVAHEAAEEALANKAMATWKNISMLVALPTCLLVAVNSIYATSKHTGEHHDSTKYSTYMRIRNKPYPWGDGDKTLFWNDHVNH